MMEPEDRQHLRNTIIDAGHVLYTAKYFASVKIGPSAPLVQHLIRLKDQIEDLINDIDMGTEW